MTHRDPNAEGDPLTLQLAYLAITVVAVAFLAAFALLVHELTPGGIRP